MNGKRHSEKTKEKMVSLYIDEKKSALEIERVLGVSYHTVYDVLKSKGIKSRTIKEARRLYMKRRWPKGEDEKIVHKFIVERKTMKQIAKELRHTTKTVAKALRRSGITSANNRITEEIAKRIVHLYLNEGKSLKAVGEDVGFSKTVVRNFLLKRGFQLRPRGRSRVDLNAEEVKRLYWDEGYSTREIGEQLGASFRTVQNLMNREGIPRRPPPRRITEVERQQIPILYKDMPVSDIAKKLGISHKSVDYWLKKFGTRKRTPRENAELMKKLGRLTGPRERWRRYYKKRRSRYRDIYADWKAGATVPELARNYGLSLEGVKRIIGLMFKEEKGEEYGLSKPND